MIGKPLLPDDLRRALADRQGRPLELTDPATNTDYVLLRADDYQRVRGLIQPAQANEDERFRVSPGIQRSRQAFLRDLPALLSNRTLERQWVAYRDDEQLLIAPREEDVIQECRRRGLNDDEYYLGIIRPHETEPEEVDRSLFEYDADEAPTDGT